MANEDKSQLDSILVEKEAPERVDDKEKAPKKVAKLTGRTIASLRSKIKGKLMKFAYSRYNKAYKKMKEDLVRADEVRQAKNDGEDITQSELVVEYNIAASYNKRLAKWGAVLLKDDIKQVVADQKVKPIKVPRFLQKKLRRLTLAYAKLREKHKTKKLQKELVKDIQKTTRQFIASEVESAMFKDAKNGDLRESVDADIIKNLGLKGGRYNTERRLETLKGFISKDGVTPMFAPSEDSELEKKAETKTSVPPTIPTASTEKEAPKINVNDLLASFDVKKAVDSEDKVEKTVVEPKQDDLKDDNKEDKKLPVPTNDKGNEQEAVLSHGKNIDRLINELRDAKTDEERQKIREKISEEKKELDKIVRNVKRTSKKESPVKKEGNSLEPIEVTEKSAETETSAVEPKKTEKNAVDGVEIKDSVPSRVTQVSNSSALRVTLQDIKKLEERNNAAQKTIDKLKEEKADLVNQKALLQQYIEQAKVTRISEQQASNMADENAALKTEVAELSTEAAEIKSALSRK